jgi:hypothetical protein
MTSLPHASEGDLGAMFAMAVPLAIPDATAFRRTIIRGKMAAGWYARANLPGQADYWVLVKGGLHVEVETKAAAESGNKAVRKAQEEWRLFCVSQEIPYMRPKALRGEDPNETVRRWVDELRVLIEARLTLDRPRA